MLSTTDWKRLRWGSQRQTVFMHPCPPASSMVLLLAVKTNLHDAADSAIII